ncbi:hypothetical protein J2Z77_000558 [Streptomyces avidinii]|uniref:Uncharacterized protein n=1 Tax=Streptomyces avidinii TaxID=1895 RepID=A0ABS4KXL5_STRAV|nr:hypothetical protein [Streptomyces avidinii]
MHIQLYTPETFGCSPTTTPGPCSSDLTDATSPGRWRWLRPGGRRPEQGCASCPGRLAPHALFPNR